MEPQSSAPMMVDEFRQALDKLMSLKCSKVIVTELDRTSQLDDQVLELQNQIQAMTSEHKSENLAFLEFHRQAIELASKESSDLNNKIQELEQKLEQEKTLYEQQSSQLQDRDSKIEAMNKDSKERERHLAQLKNHDQEVTDRSRKKDEQIRKLEKQLAEQISRSDQLEKSCSQLEKDKALADKRRDSATKEIDKIKAYTSDIHREEPPTDVFQRLYGSLFKIAMDLSHQDLADNVIGNPRALKNFVTDAKLKTNLPVVLSNSSAAKFVRGVMILASLAHRICARIFQPFYHSEDPSLRWILASESETNPEKELLCRAILVSLEPKEQAEFCEEIISDISKEMKDLASRLVPDQKAHEFSEQLRPVIKDALEIWKHMQRCKAKVEADINIGDYPNWHWRTIEPYSKTSKIKGDKDVSNDKILAVFPRVYIIDKEGHKPLFPGIVLCESQLRSIKEEIKSSNLASGMNGSSKRRMSMRGGTNEGSGENSFLASGSP